MDQEKAFSCHIFKAIHFPKWYEAKTTTVSDIPWKSAKRCNNDNPTCVARPKDPKRNHKARLTTHVGRHPSTNIHDHPCPSQIMVVGIRNVGVCQEREITKTRRCIVTDSLNPAYNLRAGVVDTAPPDSAPRVFVVSNGTHRRAAEASPACCCVLLLLFRGGERVVRTPT